MNKSFIIIILISVGLVATLFSLPKIIVGDNKKTVLDGKANRDVAPEQKAEASKKEENPDEHTSALSAVQQKEINQLKTVYLNASAIDKVKAGERLLQKLGTYQKYDSAGYYAEQLAISMPNEKTWLQAGDYYFQAYTYAINDAKALKMGEKSRESYQKALDINPNLLLAKSNMAMTYVSTPTPMQGILMLREVISQSPDFEPALFNLGLLSMKSNQFAKAVERFKHIIKNNPANTKAAFYLGISLARLGRNAEAKEILLQVKAKDKDPAVQEELSKILTELN
jgi:tetratricopeptide (TPR) repeat protein